MKDHLPVSIALLYAVTKQLETLDKFLDVKTMDFQLLKTIVSEVEIIDHDTRFLNSEHLIRYFQVTLLLGMSMFGGIMVTSITSFEDDGESVQLVWDSGVVDQFVWGQYDADFQKFIRYYQDRLSSKPQFRDYLPVDILIGVGGFLKSYIIILEAVQIRVNRLLSTKSDFIKLFEEDINRDLLFIVISSLPQEALSSLFIDISQYFPQDLEVTSPSGRKMKLSAIFDNSSLDMVFLMEKINVYLDLYFNSSLPIFKEITRSKTANYVKKLFDEQSVFNETQENILRLKESQLDSRLKLYSMFHDHLEKVNA
tara:strand:- start:58 stop:990 length:933 start_codon:yes stop_codon:yes gene_type:complete